MRYHEKYLHIQLWQLKEDIAARVEHGNRVLERFYEALGAETDLKNEQNLGKQEKEVEGSKRVFLMRNV